MREEWRYDGEVLKARVAKAIKMTRLDRVREYCANTREILVAL
ncbi:hypothetical protein ACLK1T_15900 [Escherichia coli]